MYTAKINAHMWNKEDTSPHADLIVQPTALNNAEYQLYEGSCQIWQNSLIFFFAIFTRMGWNCEVHQRAVHTEPWGKAPDQAWTNTFWTYRPKFILEMLVYQAVKPFVPLVNYPIRAFRDLGWGWMLIPQYIWESTSLFQYKVAQWD